MKRALSIGILLAAILATPRITLAETQEPLDLVLWSRAPVLDHGRVKPLDSFARDTLLGLSGKSTFERKPAIHWLTRVFLDPESTRDDEIFLVNNPEVAEALNIAAENRDRYSYRQLEFSLAELTRQARAAFSRDESARTLVDKEFIQLYHSVTVYQQLTRALDFLVPRSEFNIDNEDLRNDLGLADHLEISYLDLKLQEKRLQELLAEHGGIPPADRNDYQKALYRVSLLSRMWSQQRNSLPPSMIPLAMGGETQWLSPWDILAMPAGIRLYSEEFTALSAFSRAYRAGSQELVDEAAGRYLEAVRIRMDDPKTWKKLSVETTYNSSKAFYRSEMLYGFAFIIGLLSVAFRNRWTYRAAFLLACLALLPQTYGIVSRMIIMGRPPVTNLYSTFVFVSWCCALIGLAVEYVQRNRLGLITASSMGLALLLTARRFGADGDTMGVMVAVLDSNFWLATHVVTISIGYAGCVASGLLGHIYLLQALKRRPDDPALRETFRAVYGAQAFGLIFAFVGTMLGGVWADQSWGRFWGWDPKENGALVIVLWSAVLFHARLARMIGPRGFAAGSVIGVIWVLLAWLGVNLLSVGLHSYGFTSGIARGLAIACGFELLFVLLTVPFAKRSLGGKSSPESL